MKVRCILNCNQAACLILDEVECKCVSDIECITAEFCGGNVEDCGCKEKDGGTWCTALTNDSIKVWNFAYVYDSLTGNKVMPLYFFHLVYVEWNYTYRLDNIYLEGNEYSDPYVFTWEFDNVAQPTKIIYRNLNAPEELPEPTYYQELDIIKLNQDTLVLKYHDEEVDGLVVYVSNDL